jgi:tetratricopeptide (TPR) repeat protein
MFSLAGQLAHPFSFAWAYNCCLYVLRREWSKAQECAEAVIAISTQHGFSAGLPISLLALGETYTSQGKWAESIAQIQQSMSLARDMGAGMVRSASLTQLAAAYAGMGQRDTGLALFDEALALVQNNEEHWYEAETYRIKGELLLTQEGKSQKAKGKSQKGEDAEACFLKAIAVAQQQQAKSWELRASMSLARLWQQQGKQHAARTMLSTIYHWFTEGFDTADLRDAKALLEELKD